MCVCVYAAIMLLNDCIQFTAGFDSKGKIIKFMKSSEKFFFFVSFVVSWISIFIQIHRHTHSRHDYEVCNTDDIFFCALH